MDDVRAAWLARQRDLNRERQQRLRDKRRNARNGLVTDDNGRPNSSLQRVANNLAQGMSHNQALIQAGSSPNARSLITKAQEGLAEVCRVNGLTTVKLVKSVVDDLDAVERVETPGGSIERADSRLRPAARRDGIALLDRAGELPAAATGSGVVGGIHYHLHLDRLRALPDVVDMQPDNDCETLSVENH